MRKKWNNSIVIARDLNKTFSEISKIKLSKISKNIDEENSFHVIITDVQRTFSQL